MSARTNTARIVRRSGYMKRTSVRLSVRPSFCLSVHSIGSRSVDALHAGDIDRQRGRTRQR